MNINRRKQNPNQWRSLFLPLADTESAVYVTTFDSSQKAAVIRTDGCLVIYGLDSPTKGPYVLKQHVPTQAKHNLCSEETKAVSAVTWMQPHLSYGIAKSQKIKNPTQETLHGAVGLESGHILLFDCQTGFYGGFSALRNLLPPGVSSTSGDTSSSGGSSTTAVVDMKDATTTTSKKSERITEISPVMGWFDSAQCEQSYQEQVQGVASSYHRRSNPSFGEGQDFDTALDAAVPNRPPPSAHHGSGSGFPSGSYASSLETIEPHHGYSIQEDRVAANPYSPAEGSTLTPTTPGYGTSENGQEVSVGRGVTGLVVSTSGGNVIICRRRNPWEVFERCQLLLKSGVFSSAGPVATSNEAIFHSGVGSEARVAVVHMSQRKLDVGRKLPGYLQKTTALAADGHLCVAARGGDGIIYVLNYLSDTTSRLLSLEEEVVRLVFKRPLIVAGCKSGKIAIISVQDGSILSHSYTYSYTKPISMVVDWSMMAILTVDETQAAEILEMPKTIRRCSPEQEFECAQAKVLKRLVDFEEGQKIPAQAAKACDAAEAVVLARMCVPEEVQNYLARKTILP